MTLEWSLSSVSVVLLDGTVVNGQAASLFVDANKVPVVLQVKIDASNKASIPWSQIQRIGHA